jgi:hypothetical protein
VAYFGDARRRSRNNALESSMTYYARTALALLSLSAALVACGDEDPKGGAAGGQTAADDGAASEGGSEGGSEQGGGAGAGGEGGSALDWTGTWTVHIEYDVACESFGQVREESYSGSWPLKLQGNNDAIEVSINSGWYLLEGYGDDDGVQLAGSFPLEGVFDTALSGSRDNTVFFDGDMVLADDEVEGTLTGSFTDGGGGGDCDILDAVFVMSR